MKEDFDDAFLKGKEEIVLQHVKFLTEMLELKMTPSVVFCDGFTPAGQKALACIDPATWVIYVSRVYLSKMDATEIRETIAHEITHLFDQSHDPSFDRKLTDIKTALWKPESTSGIIMIDSDRRTDEPDEKPKKKAKADKTRCNYHLCRQKTDLKCCIHCRGYFCEDHYKPIPPEMPNFDYPNKFAQWKYKENYHPCSAYYDYLLRKEKERTKKTEVSFEKMRHYRAYPITKTDIPTADRFHEKQEETLKTWSKDTETKPALEEVSQTKPKKIDAKWKVALIILVIIACASVGLILKTILGI